MAGVDGFSPIMSPIAGSPFDPGATLANGKKPTLKSAVANVETMFISELLKEMRQSLDPGEGLFAGDHADIYGGMFDMLMAQQLTQGGGLGLASVWMKQLQQINELEQPHDATQTRGAGVLGQSMPGSPSS